MRKLFIIAIAFAALAFAGCEKERLGADVQNGVLTTITAGREAGPATKSALNEDGENLWSVGDKILVAWAGQKPNVFTSKEKEPSETAKFQGLMSVNNSGDDTKYAIYPAEDGNLVNKDGSYALQFHAEQQGQAGTYDPDAFLAVAQSSENNLSFYNVLGLLRITFAEADCDVKSVTLHPWATPDEESDPEEPEFDDPEDPEDPDDDDEGGFTPPEHVTVTAAGEDDEDEGDVEAPLIEPAVLVIIPGGVYTVEGGSAPEITGWTEDLDAIVLKAPKGETFSPDAEYYLAVPPCEFTEGVTFELLHSDGTITNVSIDNSVEVERSKIHDVFLESNPYVPVESVTFDSDEEEVEVDDTITLEPTVGPKNATDKSLVWSSSDESIATVEDGVVTGVAEGEAVITATAYDEEGNVEAEGQVTVTVTAPEEPDLGNRISYDGGETWQPLLSAGYYYDSNREGYEFLLLGEERTSFSRMTEEPSCDWFAIDLAESLFGTHLLPEKLDYTVPEYGVWYSNISWKGAPQGSAIMGAIDPEELESGSLAINADRDKNTIDLEFEAEYDGKSVIVIYHGSAIEADGAPWCWTWSEPLPENRISYDGGETWQPLLSAGYLFDSFDCGYDIVLLGEERTSFSPMDEEPACDWFMIDIAEPKLGTYELPEDLNYFDSDSGEMWSAFLSWKGAPKGGDLFRGSIKTNDVESGSLEINVDRDNNTIDLECEAVYKGKSVIVIYHGSAIESNVYIRYWEWSEPLPENRISYDGGDTWQPLLSAGYYYDDSYIAGYEILLLGEERTSFSSMQEEPSCDWFLIDIPEENLGAHPLPKDLDAVIPGVLFQSYLTWKGAPVGGGDSFRGEIVTYDLGSGSLTINVDRYSNTIDLECKAEYEGKSVWVIYHGSAIPSNDYMWDWSDYLF